jgi:hypothetical protein
MRKKYKLFISHKHDDRAIADVVSWLVKRHVSDRVEIHQSSNFAYVGPDPTQNLDAALLKWLLQADGFLLIYTTKDHDWSYCMYEYGVASNPNPPTSCFVLQCTSDKPTVNIDHVCTDARKLDDIRKFVRFFFCQTPFPGQEEPFCDWGDTNVGEVAKEFFDKLQEPIKLKRRIDWTNWPSLKIAIPAADVMSLPDEILLERITRVDGLLRNSCYVQQASYDCSSFFGYRFTGERVSLSVFINSWQNETKEDPDRWLKDLSTQIVRLLDRRVGVISRAPIVSCLDRRRLQMLITNAIKDEAHDIYEFQVLLLDFSDPRSILAGDIMIPIDYAYNKILYGQMYLLEMLKEMEVNQRNRVVLLWQDRTPAYIVEIDAINRYLVKVRREGDVDWSALSMDDLLHDREMDEIVKKSATVASPSTSLADARNIMRNHDRECRNLFITQNGVLGEKALGLLTDDAVRTA